MKQPYAFAPPTQKIVFRTAALAGSGILWIGLGYLALTYVPVIQKLQSPEPPAISVEKRVIPPPVLPPKPDPLEPAKDASTKQNPSSQPSLTQYQTNDIVSVDASESLPIGPANPAPVTLNGDGALLGPVVGPLDPFAEPEALPAPRLIINPVRREGANPAFPQKALDREISGEVTLTFTVTAQGKVTNLLVVDEVPRGYGFAEAARRAVHAWTFQPQTIDGIAVAYPARYTISFKLED